MSTIASDWDAMCSLFLKNGEQFNLSVRPTSSDLDNFRSVYENGYVRTLIGQWLTSLPVAEPSCASGELNNTDEPCTGAETIRNQPPAADQADLHNLTTERHSPTAGRHVVVAAGAPTIAADSPIISETAFALVPVYPAEYRAGVDAPKCSQCAADCPAAPALRCPDCARVGYCSQRCRTAANRAVHASECRGHRMGLFAALGVSHLAVRTLLLGDLELAALMTGFGGSEPQQHRRQWSLKSANDSANWWREMQLTTEPEANALGAYSRVLRLMTNFEKTTADDLMRYTLTAAMLTMYLKECTDYFAQSALSRLVAELAEAEVVAGALILRHIGQIINNAHTICALVVQPPLQPDGGNQQHSPDVAIPLAHLHDYVRLDVCASALYPRIAMLNHSCSPNIRNRFDGARLTICATRALAAGTEVLNCYCSVDSTLATADRQQLLSAQYGFRCECARCSSRGADNASSGDDIYLCKCGAQLQPASDATSLWWRQLDQPPASGDWRCRQCEHTMQFGWYDRFMMMFERSAGNGQQRKWLAADVGRAYAEEVCARLAFGHRMRFDLASMVVKLFPVGELELTNADVELIDLLLPVANDYALGIAQQFSAASLEHLEAAHTYLDLLALRRRLCGTQSIAPDHQKRLTELRNVIRQVTSARMQSIYTQYIADYIAL